MNVAARSVEATRTVNADYLFTADFVKRFGETGLVPLEAHEFSGVPRTIELFTLASGSRD